MNDELRGKLVECAQVAEEFANLYYNNFDKRRSNLNRLYLDTAVFAWNGNGCTGKDNIQKFLSDLPGTEHTLSSIDCQPVLDEIVDKQLTYIILTGGTVKFNNSVKPFQQSFVITADGDKWKIVNDVYRIQDAMSAEITKQS